MKLLNEYTSRSLAETDEIAKQLIPIFTEGCVVELVGNLGAGKTHFVKAFCKNLNINNVSSPSFSIVNEYQSQIKVYHFDFYRIKKINELYDIGFDEYMNDTHSIIFIEWSNMFEELLPKKRFKLCIILEENNQRLFELYINE